jgi:predicted nucleic acid-binding protein
VRNILIDAGPLIALFALDDKHHRRFDAFVLSHSEKGLRLITTWPCVVEAAHILDAPQRFEMLRWIELGAVQIYPFQAHHLGDMVGWMRRYTEKTKR